MSNTLERTGLEVDVDFLEVKDQDGHRHFLKRGDELPGWVTDEQVSSLHDRGALFAVEVI